MKTVFYSLICVCSSLAFAGDDLARMEAVCKSRGGHIEEAPNKTLVCVTNSAGATGTTNAYQPLVDDFLKWLFSPNNNNAAKQREALKRQLEQQRRDALQRKEQQHVAQLDSILAHLIGAGDLALKGMSDGNSGELKLKLGEKRPLGMEVYQHDDPKRMGISGLSGINLDNEKPTTTKAQLSLKLGESATQSSQAQPTQAQPTVPPVTPTQRPDVPVNADAGKAASPELQEMANLISQLSPEEQQKLFAAVRSAESTATSPASPAQSSNALAFKLSGTEGLGATPTGTPEEVKQQGDEQFEKLGQVSLKQMTPEPTSIVPKPLDTPPPQNPAAARQQSALVDPKRVQGTPTPQSAALIASAAPAKTSVFPANPDLPFANPLRGPDYKPEVQPLIPADWREQLRKKVEAKRPTAKPEDREMLALLFEDLAPQRKPSSDDELERLAFLDTPASRQEALSRVLTAIQDRLPTALEKRFLVAFFAPSLAVRYVDDAVFRADVDFAINQRVQDAARRRQRADAEAFDLAAAELTGAAQRIDSKANFTSLSQKPEFKKESARVRSTLDKNLGDNALQSQVYLLIYLDMDLNRLKR